MKRLKIYGLIFLVLALLISCEDPLPVELVQETSSQEYDVDVITPQPDAAVFTGYDSTGITSPVPVNRSVISLSGIKNTYKNITVSKGYAQAIFYDTTKPVFSRNNVLIGFKTLEFGRVKFDNDTARVVPHRLFYRENGVIKDTLLGVKHILVYRKRILPFRSNFPYDSSVKFHFDFFGQKPFLQTIKTPVEITAKLKLEGSRKNNDLRVELSWNKAPKGDIIVIIGGLLEGRNEIIPLIRLKSIKTDKIIIRNSLLQKIPFNKFDALIFTVVRHFSQSVSTIRLGDIFISSQSIHNIRVDTPKN